jgi:hypothetical protein
MTRASHGLAPRLTPFDDSSCWETLVSMARAFGSVADRDTYLAHHFPERRHTEIPGVLSVAGGCISLYDDIIVFHDDLAVLMGLVPDNVMDRAIR